MSDTQCLCGGTYNATGMLAVTWTDNRVNSTPPATAPKQEVWKCNRCGTEMLVNPQGSAS